MKRIDQLRNLVVIAVADGSIHEDELALLSERCSSLGMSAEEFRDAVAFGLSDAAALHLPKKRADQEAMLSDMLRMMAVDGQIAATEKQLFAVAAAKMGFDRDQINLLIDRLVQNQ
jgi:uncharacterized tellurite resistance protein B-like protein